jgi:hypothetical protein
MAYKELATFPSEWEVWKRLLQRMFFKPLSFKLKVYQRKFFNLLRVSMLKFEKVCEREFFELLKASMLKFEVRGKEVFNLLKALSFK